MGKGGWVGPLQPQAQIATTPLHVSPASQIAPAPGRIGDEQFGVSSPEGRVLGDGQRGCKGVGASYRV